MKKAIGIIPARYDSKRFPGKPLAMILGKSLLQRSYELAMKVKSLKKEVFVATDNEEIQDVVEEQLGSIAIMTSPDHTCGTDRVAEAFKVIPFSDMWDIIINIQCDEIKFEPEIVDSLVELLQDPTIQMATLAHRNRNMDMNLDENIVKVGINEQGDALWFSRSPIPFIQMSYFTQHVGIYGYQRDFLLKYKDLPDCPEERVDNLEQLRALRAGVKIKVIESASATLSINTPDDITAIEERDKNA